MWNKKIRFDYVYEPVLFVKVGFNNLMFLDVLLIWLFHRLTQLNTGFLIFADLQ